MKILVTGANGQLGHDILKELKSRNIACVGVTHSDFDVADNKAVKLYIQRYKPDIIIHCGAYTEVDKAESEVELCRLTNVEGTRNIAEICKILNCTMIYISTDYIFDGRKKGEYEVDDIPNPQNVYGKTKLEGENIVRTLLKKYFIIRTSWAYGINGQNFVKTIIKLSKEKKKLEVVADQYGSPTYTYDLAQLLCDMCFSNKYGVYHVTNEGTCNWAEFAEAILQNMHCSTEIVHVTTAKYGAKACRPMNSRLSKKKLKENGFNLLRNWQDALKEYIDILQKEDI